MDTFGIWAMAAGIFMILLYLFYLDLRTRKDGLTLEGKEEKDTEPTQSEPTAR